ELFLVPHEVFGDLLEEVRTLVKGEGPYGRATDSAGMVDHPRDVGSVARHAGPRFAGVGVGLGRSLVHRGEPRSLCVALQYFGHLTVLSSEYAYRRTVLQNDRSVTRGRNSRTPRPRSSKTPITG